MYYILENKLKSIQNTLVRIKKDICCILSRQTRKTLNLGAA